MSIFICICSVTRANTGHIDPTCTLLTPHRVLESSSPIVTKITKALATRFDVPRAKFTVLKECVSNASVEEWGRVAIDDGDTVYSASSLNGTPGEDRRDATYVRVSLFPLCSCYIQSF